MLNKLLLLLYSDSALPIWFAMIENFWNIIKQYYSLICIVLVCKGFQIFLNIFNFIFKLSIVDMSWYNQQIL